MTRAWGLLAAAVLALVLGLAVVARLPRRPVRPAAPAPLPPIDAVSLVVRDGAVAPARTEGVLGHRLAVTAANDGSVAVRLALSGYEHGYEPRVLAPGESRHDTLLLDLPGEDFAWMLDGRPAAQLRVAGSHLVEGHR